MDLLDRLKPALGPDYVLEREIGRGGMATVFLANDTALGRKVAIKVLKPTAVATYYAFAGKIHDALEWTERAFEMRDSDLTYLAVMPLPDAMRTHPRFLTLLRRLRLPANV